MKTRYFFQILIDYGLLSTLFLFPLFINISLIAPADPGHPLIAVNVSLADMMTGIIFLLWILKVLINNEWKQIKLPPAPVLFFTGAGILSFVNAFSLVQWLKELVQMIEYFLVFYVLLINNFHTIKFTTLKNSLLALTTGMLLVAFVQHTFLKADPYFVKGLFENRNILGTFLCMTIPIVYVELLSCNHNLKKVWMGTLLLITCLVLVSGSAMLSILISLFTVSWLFGKKVFFRFLGTALFIVAIYPLIMPSKNIHSLKEFASIYEQGSIRENFYRRLALLGDLNKNMLVSRNIGNNGLLITSDRFTSVKMPEISEGERYKDMEGTTQIKNRYLEMQASLNMIAQKPLTGAGLGNYQNGIGSCYAELPKVNTAEPNQHNGYLIIASTTGILGLSGLLWLFFLMFGNVRKRNRSNRDDKYIYLGLMGSILACMVENFFCYLFTAGLLVPFIFMIYLSSNEQ